MGYGPGTNRLDFGTDPGLVLDIGSTFSFSIIDIEDVFRHRITQEVLDECS